VYRVDLRLGPYGRDGELAVRSDRAVEYYRDKAQNWERQMLIRARTARGSRPRRRAFRRRRARRRLSRRAAARTPFVPSARRRGKIDRQETYAARADST
jgi:glutamate-ammonia-ligase adenylyltransferase